MIKFKLTIQMNFNLSEEHIMIRDAARDFAMTELLPGVIERDENQIFPVELSVDCSIYASKPLFRALV